CQTRKGVGPILCRPNIDGLAAWIDGREKSQPGSTFASWIKSLKNDFLQSCDDTDADGWFEINRTKIYEYVERARVLFYKRQKKVIPQSLDADTLRSTLPATEQTERWAEDIQRGYRCFGKDIKVTPAGRGTLRYGAVALDLGARKPVTAVTEKGDIFDCGERLVAFLRFGNAELAAKQQYISQKCNEDSEVERLYAALEQFKAELPPLPQQTEDEEEWREKWRRKMAREDEMLKEIAEVKKRIEDGNEVLRRIREDEVILRQKMKARIARFQDEISNFFTAFKLVVIPPLETQRLVSNDKPNHIDGMSKTILVTFSHTRLVELIKEKVSKAGGRVLLTTEAFTTKTCSRCGHHQHVGASKVFKCKNKECGAVMDRDGNAAINILRDTLLRVLEFHRRQTGGHPREVTQFLGDKNKKNPSPQTTTTNPTTCGSWSEQHDA
ncbi:hypothetical protein HDU96_006543, partial [Phlyctochytrium bullatum]